MAQGTPTQEGLAEARRLADDTGVRRLRIDELDGLIISMLRERRELAADIQRLRLDSGGVRRDLAREIEIVKWYRSTFGSAGPVLAAAVLEVCRVTP